MKKFILVFSFLFISTLVYSQSNKDIAKVYIKRANEAIESSIDYNTALEHFKKAMKYMDTITDRKIASLGSLIYFEEHHKQENAEGKLDFLKKSEAYSKQYFNLSKNKSSEEYTNNVENFVLIQETISNLEKEIKELEEERIAKEKELRRIDSLKTLWKNKSKELSINVDGIYTYNKNNLALFTKNGNFGIINDVGEIIIEANEYKDALSFDGYFLLKNKKDEATKVYIYNTNNNNGFLLPNVSDFNSISTHYGQIMLPRGNGRLVTYPNNSYQPMVFDLNVQKVVRVQNEKELFKKLKKGDIIDKYNKDGEVKINKKWYTFGGHVGGGIHPLYFNKNYQVHSYLCSIDGKILLAASDYKYIGSFHNNKIQAIYNGKTSWINQNGTKVSDAKDDSGKYAGNSKLKKLENGNYQIIKDGIIILGKEKLKKMSDYLRKHSNN